MKSADGTKRVYAHNYPYYTTMSPACQMKKRCKPASRSCSGGYGKTSLVRAPFGHTSSDTGSGLQPLLAPHMSPLRIAMKGLRPLQTSLGATLARLQIPMKGLRPLQTFPGLLLRGCSNEERARRTCPRTPCRPCVAVTHKPIPLTAFTESEESRPSGIASLPDCLFL